MKGNNNEKNKTTQKLQSDTNAAEQAISKAGSNIQDEILKASGDNEQDVAAQDQAVAAQDRKKDEEKAIDAQQTSTETNDTKTVEVSEKNEQEVAAQDQKKDEEKAINAQQTSTKSNDAKTVEVSEKNEQDVAAQDQAVAAQDQAVAAQDRKKDEEKAINAQQTSIKSNDAKTVEVSENDRQIQQKVKEELEQYYNILKARVEKERYFSPYVDFKAPEQQKKGMGGFTGFTANIASIMPTGLLNNFFSAKQQNDAKLSPETTIYKELKKEYEKNSALLKDVKLENGFNFAHILAEFCELAPETGKLSDFQMFAQFTEQQKNAAIEFGYGNGQKIAYTPFTIALQKSLQKQSKSKYNDFVRFCSQKEDINMNGKILSQNNAKELISQSSIEALIQNKQLQVVRNLLIAAKDAKEIVRDTDFSKTLEAIASTAKDNDEALSQYLRLKAEDANMSIQKVNEALLNISDAARLKLCIEKTGHFRADDKKVNDLARSHLEDDETVVVDAGNYEMMQQSQGIYQLVDALAVRDPDAASKSKFVEIVISSIQDAAKKGQTMSDINPGNIYKRLLHMDLKSAVHSKNNDVSSSSEKAQFANSLKPTQGVGTRYFLDATTINQLISNHFSIAESMKNTKENPQDKEKADQALMLLVNHLQVRPWAREARGVPSKIQPMIDKETSSKLLSKLIEMQEWTTIRSLCSNKTLNAEVVAEMTQKMLQGSTKESNLADEAKDANLIAYLFLSSETAAKEDINEHNNVSKSVTSMMARHTSASYNDLLLHSIGQRWLYQHHSIKLEQFEGYIAEKYRNSTTLTNEQRQAIFVPLFEELRPAQTHIYDIDQGILKEKARENIVNLAVRYGDTDIVNTFLTNSSLDVNAGVVFNQNDKKKTVSISPLMTAVMSYDNLSKHDQAYAAVMGERYKYIISSLLKRSDIKLDQKINFNLVGAEQDQAIPIALITFLVTKDLIKPKDMLSLLSSKKVSIQHVDADGNNLLSIALNANNFEVANALLDAYPELATQKNHNKQLPIHCACMLQRDADLDSPEGIQARKEFDVKLAKATGSLIHEKDVGGKNAMSYAMLNDNLELAKILIEHGANITSDTIVCAYATTNPAHTIKTLDESLDSQITALQAKQNSLTDAKDDTNQSKDNASIERKISDLKSMQALISREQFSAISRKGTSTLAMACMKGNIAAVKEILENAPSLINHVNEDGATPLMTAVANNNAEIVQYLLSRKDLDLNMQNENGDTALIMAANLHIGYKSEYDQKSNAEQKQGDANLKDNTAILYEFLNRDDLDINKKNNYGVNALTFLSLRNKDQSLVTEHTIMEDFLRKGADPLSMVIERTFLSKVKESVMKLLKSIINLKFIIQAFPQLVGFSSKLDVGLQYYYIGDMVENMMKDKLENTLDTNKIQTSNFNMIGSYSIDKNGVVHSGNDLKELMGKNAARLYQGLEKGIFERSDMISLLDQKKIDDKQELSLRKDLFSKYAGLSATMSKLDPVKDKAKLDAFEKLRSDILKIDHRLLRGSEDLAFEKRQEDQKNRLESLLADLRYDSIKNVDSAVVKEIKEFCEKELNARSAVYDVAELYLMRQIQDQATLVMQNEKQRPSDAKVSELSHLSHNLADQLQQIKEYNETSLEQDDKDTEQRLDLRLVKQEHEKDYRDKAMTFVANLTGTNNNNVKKNFINGLAKLSNLCLLGAAAYAEGGGIGAVYTISKKIIGDTIANSISKPEQNTDVAKQEDVEQDYSIQSPKPFKEMMEQTANLQSDAFSKDGNSKEPCLKRQDNKMIFAKESPVIPEKISQYAASINIKPKALLQLVEEQQNRNSSGRVF